jgi:2-oxoisovalerate dehydrogenase E1 component alpha subunit
MLRTRVLDDRLVTLQRQGRIGFHIGSLGEEAAILGSAFAMRDQDWMFPCYREFGGALWRGMPLQRYVDNMFGNANDPVKGRQMPDHYTCKAAQFGSVSSPSERRSRRESASLGGPASRRTTSCRWSTSARERRARTSSTTA